MEDKESIYLKIESGDLESIDTLSQYDLEILKTNISTKLANNEVELKNIIMKNSELIIELFNNAKNLKEDLLRSKKNLELLDCQVSIIKKKFLDSYEKFENIIENKKNIDKTIEIFDRIKVFKSEIKLFKLHMNSNDQSMLDSQTVFSAFSKIKQIIKQNELIFKDIDYIKKDLEYFLTNQKTIISNFENRLTDAILKKDNNQILKFIEYFSSLGTLVEQIHTFTNSFLTETIAKTYLAKIKKITDIFKNQQNDNNIIKPESIIDARDEFKNSLDEIGKMKDCMQNFCLILRSEFDKTNFVLFDQILENQGFKNLFSLFSDRIRKLIVSALSKIQKFPDTFSYFQKDYLVLHFIMKEFCLNNSIDFIIIPQIKDAFIEQFKASIFDNLTLGINLIMNAEKTFNSTVSNSLVKSHLIDYMISYLYQLNNIFIELEIEFSLKKENNVLEDELITYLVEIVSNLFNEIYLKKLLYIIDCIFVNTSQVSSQKNPMVTTQNYDFNLKKFNFYIYILIKLQQTLEDIADKNERLLGRKLSFSLINQTIQSLINDNITSYFRNYFAKFLSRISNEIRVIFLEKEINEFKSILEKVCAIILEYVSCFDEDFINNKFYEAFTVKYVFFNYFYLSFILLLSINKQNENDQNLGFFDSFLETFNKYFLKEVNLISYIHKDIKNSFYYNQEQLINQIKSSSNEIYSYFYFIRLIFIEKKALFAFLKKQKINIEFFAKSLTLIFLTKFNLNLNELVTFENNSKANIEEIYRFLSEFSEKFNVDINLLKNS